MRLLVTAFAACQILATSPPEPDPFAFFRPTVMLTPKDRESLARGSPLIRFLPGGGRDLGAFTAVAVPDVTVVRAAAWMRREELLRENSYVVATQRFSTPPNLTDLTQLSLEDEDLEDIRRCSPGHCGVKLSTAEIRELRSVVALAGDNWKTDVQHAFRQIVLRRVLGFAARGHAGQDDLWDHKRPISPARVFAQLVHQTSFLAAHTPDLVKALLSCSSTHGAGGETFLYWSKERLGGKAVISVTQVILFDGAKETRPSLLMVGTQVFATHYLDASLTVTAFVEDHSSSRAYFVYMHRSDVDLLDGFWGSPARSVIERRVRKDGPAILRRVGARMASGDPPVSSNRHAWPAR